MQPTVSELPGSRVSVEVEVPASDVDRAVGRAARSLARVESLRFTPALEGGEVYTDDRAPVEWLVDESLLEYANGD